MAREPAAWLVLALLVAGAAADFTTACARPCDCRWQSGNKAAVCVNATLRAVPPGLSGDVQILDLSHNDLRELRDRAFHRAGLDNLKKVFLRECNLGTVHRAAFATLAIVIELDLSKNHLRRLHADTFRGTEKLRLVNLNDNALERLEDGLFRSLRFLQKVELSNNRIATIEPRAFVDLPQLKILRIDGNKLSHMRVDALAGLASLSGLDLHGNPWRCDCELRPFRDWAIARNLYTAPTSCALPAAVRARLWTEVEAGAFACQPSVLEPRAGGAAVRALGENVTLSCKVSGSPAPEVSWLHDGRAIEPRAFGELRYVVTEGGGAGAERWVNLTLVRARPGDRGNYTCVAASAGGRAQGSMLLLPRTGGSGGLSDAGAALGGCLAAAALVLAAATVCCVSRRGGDTKRLIKSGGRGAGGDAPLDSVVSEEKGSKPAVNPVTKPPRRPEPRAPAAGAEPGRTLLHNDCVRGSVEEELRVEAPPLPSPPHAEFRPQPRACPPDLLAFPPPTGPPAGLPALHRLHAATTSPKGYVTLPRRPRSHLPDRSPVFSTVDGATSYCDFDMKLFGNGGPYYSLNSSEVELCSELAPSPAPATPHAAPLLAPRGSLSSPDLHLQLLWLQALAGGAGGRRGTWRGRTAPPPPPRPRKRPAADFRDPFLSAVNSATQV